jgi:hypothetical protein
MHSMIFSSSSHRICDADLEGGFALIHNKTLVAVVDDGAFIAGVEFEVLSLSVLLLCLCNPIAVEMRHFDGNPINVVVKRGPVEVLSSTTIAREFGSTRNELMKFRLPRLAAGCLSSETVHDPTLELCLQDQSRV